MAPPALGVLGLLPREIRALIYDFFLKDHWSNLLQRVMRMDQRVPKSYLIYKVRDAEMIRRLAITTTSRELRREVLETFFSTNEFCQPTEGMLIHLIENFSKDIDVVAHSRQLGVRYFALSTKTQDLYPNRIGGRRRRITPETEFLERERLFESLRTCHNVYQIPAQRFFITCHYGQFLQDFVNGHIKRLPEHQHFPVWEVSKNYELIEARIWMGDERASIKEVNDMVAWLTVYLQGNLERMLAHLKKYGQDLPEAEHSDPKHRLIDEVSLAITMIEFARDYHLKVIGEMMEFWYAPNCYDVAEFFSMAGM